MTLDNTTRPTIDFSGVSRATARDYAFLADSRVLKDESRATLQAVSMGSKFVDAYALNAAVTDAMRSATTRMGQSMARRDLARKVAYLGHITQAVLEAHADGLPAYEVGERSRLLEEVKPALAKARETLDRLSVANQELRDDREGLKVSVQRLTEERQLLTEERDSVTADALTLITRLAEQAEKLRKANSESEVLQAVVAYVIERLPDEQIQRVLGYWDGVKDGLTDKS